MAKSNAIVNFVERFGRVSKLMDSNLFQLEQGKIEILEQAQRYGISEEDVYSEEGYTLRELQALINRRKNLK